MEISNFSIDGLEYTLKKPVSLYEKDGCALNDELGIMVVIYEGIPGQVEQFAKQQLADLYSAYVECPEYELSKCGKEFKEKLQDMVI